MSIADGELRLFQVARHKRTWKQTMKTETKDA